MIQRGAFLVLVLFFAGAAGVHAQSILSGAASNLALSMTPEYPAPGNIVRLSAASPHIDLEQADIAWYVNGTITAQGPAKKVIDIPAGSLGSETDVVAVASASDGTSASGEVFIRPVEVDLLWESDSYVPPFYRGRALPSPGTTIRAWAIARIKNPNGVFAPERDIVYTWRRNGSIVQPMSGRGRSSATFPAPPLFGADSLTVNAATADGAFEGSASVRIAATEPSLALFEDHPLFGVLYNDALASSESRSDSEATFRAVPFFAQAGNPTDPRLIYAWSVNGKNLPADSASPDEITIGTNGASGLAQIALALTEAGNWAVNSKGVWSISFSSGGSSPATDPFQTPAQQ